MCCVLRMRSGQKCIHLMKRLYDDLCLRRSLHEAILSIRVFFCFSHCLWEEEKKNGFVQASKEFMIHLKQQQKLRTAFWAWFDKLPFFFLFHIGMAWKNSLVMQSMSEVPVVNMTCTSLIACCTVRRVRVRAISFPTNFCVHKS